MPSYRAMPVLMIHKRDGHVIERFESAAAASKALGKWPDEATRAARRKSISKGPYILRFEKDWTGREDFADGSYNRPIIAYVGGKLLWFSGTKAAATALHMSREALTGAIGKQTAVCGVQARYARSTDDWPSLMGKLKRSSSDDEHILAAGA